MSSRPREKPGHVLERADRNVHTGAAIFLKHAEQDNPRLQLLPEDRSYLLEQANNVNKLMDDSHRVHDGRLTGWFKSRSRPGRKTIEDYHQISSDYSQTSMASSEKTDIRTSEQIDLTAPWSSNKISSKASKERHAYIKHKMEKVISTPDTVRGAPHPPGPPPPPPSNPPSTRTGIRPRNIDAHGHPASIPPSTISSANDRTPRENLSESSAPIMWRRRSRSTPGASSYHATSSDDDDDDDSSQPPWFSHPAPLQPQSGGNPPTTSRPRDAARGQVRSSPHITASETTMSETLHPSLTATESYDSMHSYSTAATVGMSSPRTGRLSSSTVPRYSQFTASTVPSMVTIPAPHPMSSYSTAATVGTSSPRTSRLSSSPDPRYSQFTAATVATSAPGEYPPDTPMNSMGGISSHLDSQSPQPPMPSSYHAAPRPSDASDNRRTHTTRGHPSSQVALSSYGGGMLHPPTTQAPPPTPQTSTGYHGHAYHTQDTDTAHHPHPSTNSATAFPPHPTGAYHSSPAAQHSQTQPAGLSQRSSQDSTTTNSTDHWSTTANVGSRR